MNEVLNCIKKIRTRKMLKTLKKYWEKNERTSQRTHVQNHVYANKSRHTYICNVCQLSNPVVLVIT